MPTRDRKPDRENWKKASSRQTPSIGLLLLLFVVGVVGASVYFHFADKSGSITEVITAADIPTLPDFERNEPQSPSIEQHLPPVEETPAIRGRLFDCPSPHVVDGDTLRCGSLRVRLQSIDAPEKDARCRPGRQCVEGDPIASTHNLERLVRGHRLQCEETDIDRYGRTVAICHAGQVNLSCAQVQMGFAVERYGRLSCDN